MAESINNGSHHINMKRSRNESSESRGAKTAAFIEDLKNIGILKSVSLGSKICFPTNKLNYEQIETLKKLLKVDEEEHPWTSFSTSNSGWFGISVPYTDNIKPGDNIRDAIDQYRKYAEEDKDLFISSYGEAKFVVDFSKTNMLMFENGDILYPYGAFFFSDNKSAATQFAASVACIPSRYNKIRNKRYISPITSDNWDNATINCNFTRHGHLVIFYVDKDIEKEPDVYHPIVTTIDIEVFAKKDFKTSEITKLYFGRAEKNSKCVPDIQEYLVKEVYSRYAIDSFVATQFMSDYLYSIGCNPDNYDLTIPDRSRTTEEDKSFKFKSNFAGNKKIDRSKLITHSDTESSEENVREENEPKVIGEIPVQLPKTETEEEPSTEGEIVTDEVGIDEQTVNEPLGDGPVQE